MAHKGLDSFFNKESKSLADLDWLDINQAEYKNLPFDPTPEYIMVPKLEKIWDHTDDQNSFNLVPNSDLDFNYKSPDTTKLDNSNMKDVNQLLDYTKTQMMAGKKGNQLINLIKNKSATHIIKKSYEYLEKLSKEQGLLGNVYIDPTVFNKCTDGAEFVRKRAKTAKYVVAMSKCAGCAFKRDNRCEVYKKHLASEVSYDQDLFDFYNKHFSSLGRDSRIASKQDLANAFTFEKKKETKVAEYKPKISKKEEDEETLEKKKEKFEKQFTELKKELSEKFSSKISKEIAVLMVKGASNKSIKEHLSLRYSSADIIKNKKTISAILSKQGTLGKVYLDASLLPVNICNAKEAKLFFENNARDVKYVLSNCSCTSCSCKSILSKKVISNISEIPNDAWDSSFKGYSDDIRSKLSSIYSENKEKGLRLAYLQSELELNNIKSPKKVESYNLKATMDTTEYSSVIDKDIYFTPKKIVAALDKGFTISSIISTGKNLGVKDKEIKSNIREAFKNHVATVNKYQLDVPMDYPVNLKIKLSGKDVSMDLDKPLTEIHTIAYNSSEAPIDSMVTDLGLKESGLDSSLADNKYENIEISGLDQFTID